jgi:hypothetical protein
MLYGLAGLRINSDLPLAGLAHASADDSLANLVTIRCGPISAPPRGSTVDFPDELGSGDAMLLNIPEVARYLLRGGDEILVDQAPGSDPGDVRAYLLGTMFGMLCHRRGIPPLHASTIEIPDGCVAFIGPSGMGKSTLAAALARRGHQLLADDVCFLQRAGGEIRAWPGVQRIRLWDDALDALKWDGRGIERESRGWNKFVIPVEPPANPCEPRCLRRIYHLHEAPPHEEPSITRLHGAAVIEILMQNIYRLGLAERMGHKAQAFVMCAAVAREVPVFRFSRPRTFDRLREGVELLESHLRAPVNEREAGTSVS